MTVGSSLDAQLAFLSKFADSFTHRVEKVEHGMRTLTRTEQSHMVYTDEWLRTEMGKLRDRLSLPIPELQSQLNDLDRRMSRIEDTFETLLARLNRIERDRHGKSSNT